MLVGEGGFFAHGLEFDEFAGAGHDDVEVDFGVFVFDVVEIEDGGVLEDADADGGDGVGERGFFELAVLEEFCDGAVGGDVGAGDGGGASTAVGLEDIAVDPEGVAWEFF